MPCVPCASITPPPPPPLDQQQHARSLAEEEEEEAVAVAAAAAAEREQEQEEARDRTAEKEKVVEEEEPVVVEESSIWTVDNLTWCTCATTSWNMDIWSGVSRECWIGLFSLVCLVCVRLLRPLVLYKNIYLYT